MISGVNLLREALVQGKQEEIASTQAIRSLDSQESCSIAELGRALMNSTIGLAVLEADGSFTGMNIAFCRMTGYGESDLLGRNFRLLLPPRIRASRMEFEKILNAGEPGVAEIQIATRQQGVIWIRCNFSPRLDDRGKPAGVINLVENVTERKLAGSKVQELAASLLHAQDEERRHIARELHDNTGQSLAALVMILAGLEKELPQQTPESRKSLQDGMMLAKESARELRTLSYLLHPPVLDELRLVGALKLFLRGFSRRSGIQVKLHASRRLKSLPGGLEVALYRVIQESLNNVHRHSGSKRAVVRIKAYCTHVILEVQDHGRGMDGLKTTSIEKHPGIGISGMRERMWQLGGDLEIQSSKRGTLVRARLPIKENQP